MKLTSEELARGSGGVLIKEGARGSVCTDTRAIQPGDWFLALRGERFDAHDFLTQAIEAGASGVIAERVPDDWSHGHIAVNDGLEALQQLGRFVRSRFDGPVVGITGSAGKTTTRAMIGLALEELGEVHQTAGNFNNHIGLPLTLLASPRECNVLVLEMGMNHSGEIALLQDIGAPTVRVITNVGIAHLEGLGSIEAIANAKAELFDGARPTDTLCVNMDDPFIRDMAFPAGCTLVRYGSSQQCDIQLQAAHIDPERLHTRYTVSDGTTTWTGELPSPGIHMAHNAVAAIAVGYALGLNPRGIVNRLARYAPVGMRLRIEPGPLGTRVINDAYNANPMSVAANLRTLASIPSNNGRKRIALLGDMLELGPTEVEQHAEIGRLALGLGIDIVGFAGPRFTKAMADSGLCSPDAESLANLIRDQVAPGDILFIKGSRGMKMERVLHALEPMETP